MSEKLWAKVDEYLVERLIPADAALTAAREANVAAKLPAIDVSPAQGKFLYLLAKIHGAKRILEVGTLGGYSTIWLARALPEDGRLVTLELEEKHAAVARKNIERAGLAARVELRLGPAAESMAALVREGVEAFDLIFIDADKPNNPVYLEWALALARVGAIIIVDNVIREGAVVDAKSKDTSVRGTRELFDLIAANKRLEATALQTVGSKGYDGFVVAIVRE
ncbi:MAG TPA: O-methyltransferase [Acidobacteriaceae bacterium]|jgi:predicted O-methyltransferase YrrM|nr:O-methyltransferase [Acidobacteriaceae bacterium]